MGTKHLGWFATVSFLAINGFNVTMPHDDAFELVMGVSDGTLDAEEIAAALGPATAPRRP